MDENTQSVLLQVAGYLTLIARRITPTPSIDEAKQLLDKIGSLFSEEVSAEE